MADVPRWIFVLVLTGGFLVFAAYNAWIAWERLRDDPAPSPAPIAGGVLGLGAVLAMPLGDLGDRLPYAFIPLVLDAGCLPYLAIGLWQEFKMRR